MRQYTIKKVTGQIDWAEIPALDVDNYLWCEELDIRMKSQICYDEEGLHVHSVGWHPHTVFVFGEYIRTFDRFLQLKYDCLSVFCRARRIRPNILFVKDNQPNP